MSELTNHFMLVLRDRAEAAIEANEKLLDAYRKGEDDPMTDRFKSVSMTCSASERALAETAKPDIIRALVNRIFYLQSVMQDIHGHAIMGQDDAEAGFLKVAGMVRDALSSADHGAANE